MTNERAGKTGCATSLPMRKQKDGSGPKNAIEQERLCIISAMVFDKGRSCLFGYAKYETFKWVMGSL